MNKNDQLIHNVGLILILLIMGAVLILSILADPSKSLLAPKCFLFTNTGLKCPACGTQRAIFHLSQGEWYSAWTDNSLFILFIIALIFYLLMRLVQKVRKRSFPSILDLLNKWIWIFLLITIVFTIFRNILSP